MADIHQTGLRVIRRVVGIKDATALLLLILFTLLIAPIYIQNYISDTPKVQNGIVDFSDWDFGRNTPTLEGDWQFFWKSLAADINPDNAVYAYVPGLWTDMEPAYPLKGYASYRLEIRGLAPGIYEVHFPMLYTAATVWLDGRQVSVTGQIGTTADTTRTVFQPHSIFITSDGEPHELVLEQSVFHHRANGIEIVPVIGTIKGVSAYKQLLSTKDMLLHAAFVILSLYGFTIFVFQRDDKSSLYFGLFCGLAGVSMLVMGVNVVELAIPDISLRLLLFILYVPFAAAYAFFALYIGALYPAERLAWVDRIFVTLFLLMSAAHAVLLVFGETLTSSYIVPVLGVVGIPFFIYILSIITRAVLNGRDGAGIMLLGTVIFVGFLSNDLLVEANVLHRDEVVLFGVGEFGVVVFLLSQVMILAGRWSVTLSRSQRLATDLSQLIDMSSAVASDETLPNLLGRIVHSGRRFLNADRGTLFLYDEDTDELWSMVAEGVTNREIRISADTGLAGACFRTGEIIRVNDAYGDERFLSSVDEQTGFQTREILSVPVETKAGKRIGVMQVLNKEGSLPFDEADKYKLVAFASQAAISLENADLFGKIVQARKYNENILASMSNGVISINRNYQVEKVNRAAVDIWGGVEDAYVGQNAAEILAQNNEWLKSELLAASADGEARTYVDIDIHNYDGDTKSVNLSIVPLADEESDMGLLLLLEDITQEKRLKGTMSRFMTKEVADRIMEEGSEALSGITVNASVLFADMRRFTSLTEELGAQETVAMLNEFFSKMTDVIFTAHGVLDKFIGDAIMAVFGTPLESDIDADNALGCALGMMQALGQLNQARQARGEGSIAISIGIATGEVVAGTIGSAKRMEYTVVGDSVNLASRLENLTRYYGADIIVSEGTMNAALQGWTKRELDLIRVKGRDEPVVIYHLLAEDAPEITFLDQYERGLAQFRARNWIEVIRTFEQVLKNHPPDRPSAIYLERAKLFAANPPPKDWDGVWTMQDKS